VTETLLHRPKALVLPPDGFLALEFKAPEDVDLWVVNCAKVSFGKRATELGDSERAIMGFLAKNHHTTPFRHNCFCFHVQCPIGVAREWMRHTVGWTYNEFSTRYSGAGDRPAYIPAIDHMRTQVGKPGRYTFEPIDPAQARGIQDKMDQAYTRAFLAYDQLLDRGVAKEVARNVLPVGMYTEFIATTNLHGIFHFLGLRDDPNALREIRDYAQALKELVRPHAPAAVSFFEENPTIGW
jgi:thymidylate synthase (FAD)